MISSRLHAAIFACFGETPFMLNEYHRKCSDFLSNVDYNEGYRLYNSDYDVATKSDQIIEIINNKSSYTYPRKTEEMIAQARLNFTEIKI